MSDKYQCSFCFCYIEETDNGACRDCVPRLRMEGDNPTERPKAEMTTDERCPEREARGQQESGKLKPCPFEHYGEHRLTVITDELGELKPAWMNKQSQWVQCSCGARGPNFSRGDEAIPAWNRRTPMPAAEARTAADLRELITRAVEMACCEVDGFSHMTGHVTEKVLRELLGEK